MKYFLALSTCLLGAQFLFSQAVSGMVIDSISGAPVPFAAVQYAPGEGVITNEEGYFQFHADNAATREITISCLGYVNKTLPLDIPPHSPLLVKLKESVVQLSEVFLSNKVPDADAIMAQVRARIDKNYRPNFKVHRIFSRETNYVDFEQMDFEVARASNVSQEILKRSNKELDSLAKNIVESKTMHFRDYLGNLYFKDQDSSKLQVSKATSLLDSKRDFSMENIQDKAQRIVLQYLDTTQSYKIKTGIIKIEDSLKLAEEFNESDEPMEYNIGSLRSGTQELLNTSHFHEGSFLRAFLEPGAYDFRFNKATFLNDELIYILDYSPGRGKSKYRGQVFVNGSDFAIVKLNYGYGKGKRGRKFNMKLLLGIKYLEDTDRGTILYKKAEDSTYTASYVQRTRGSYFYLSRPVKFIENSRDKAKVTFKFTLAGSSRDKEELLITSTTPLEKETFHLLKEPEDIKVIELNKYDETIWQEEETLQPLEEMRQFNAIQ